jgi:hypothetical protein
VVMEAAVSQRATEALVKGEFPASVRAAR